MKNYGRKVAATTMMVAGLSMGAVPAFAAAGGASTTSTAPTAKQESATVAQCRTKADLPAVASCLKAAKVAGQLTDRTNIPVVVAQETRARAAATQAAAAKVAATQTAAPEPASGRLGAADAPTVCTPPLQLSDAGLCINPGDEPGNGNGGGTGGNGNGGTDPVVCVSPQIPTDAGLCIDPPTETPDPTPTPTPTPDPTDPGTVIPPIVNPGTGNGSGGNHGPGKNHGPKKGSSGTGAVSAGNGSGVDGAGSSPEGVVSSRAQTSVPVNSACSDAAICQAAAAPTTSTSSSSTGGLPDTGAPAHAEGLLALGAALVLGGGLMVSRPRRVPAKV